MNARPRDALRTFAPVTWDALRRFERDDGWAISAHIALNALLAIFPFVIFVTALAAFLGAGQLSTQIVHLIFDTWPTGVAAPLASEVDKVLTVPRGGVLTIGVLLTLWVSSSAVEAVRVALGRAYHSPTSKPVWLSRLQSIWFVALGAVGLVVVAVFIVLWPIVWSYAIYYAYWLEAFAFASDVLRYLLTVVVLGSALVMAHLWLPGGRRRVREVLPGVVFTMAVWLAGATGFSVYLGHFANYASTYAGLAGAMTAIVFMNVSAAIFILGAEFNAALADRRRRKAALPTPALKPADPAQAQAEAQAQPA
ncbi:YihY/virulence factor BrkB family protein [Hansschlegelia quercus]|uniref:YihY/virulence factor BrkB family protein n=1 Tax=Hansschlegelia quercus TaxID=2528245 RepID=A0A4Q9GKC2_9HYPH|nr:YihY/virulence factor BrkB family protein [Hansschlegelia quercus]TBN53781.1 YihY/virulence factor BrkB family protein [Hansschlegelia quercus]